MTQSVAPLHEGTVAVDDSLQIRAIFLDYANIIILIPPLDFLKGVDVDRYKQRLLEALRPLSKASRLTRLRRLFGYAMKLLQKKDRDARLQSLSELKSGLSVTTQTANQALAFTRIEYDGDITQRLVSGEGDAWSIAQIHQANVEFSMSMWRDDILTLLEVIGFAVRFWRLSSVLTLASTGLSIGTLLASSSIAIPAVPLSILMTLITVALHQLRR